MNRHLIEGASISNKTAVIDLAENLERELPQMQREHQEIFATLADLKDETKEAKKDEYLEFADNLSLHARMEEDVLYPAAILVDRYLSGMTSG